MFVKLQLKIGKPVPDASIFIETSKFYFIFAECNKNSRKKKNYAKKKIRKHLQ